MKSGAENKIRFYCEILLSVLTVALGAVFIFEVADIYYSGGEVIYSREIVGKRLRALIVPVVIWLAAVIACFVLSVIYPRTERVKPASADERVRRLRTRIPSAGNEDFAGYKKRYAAFEKGRRAIYALATVCAAASAVLTVIWLTKIQGEYEGEINAAVLWFLRRALPLVLATFLLFIAAAVYEKVTAKKELKCMEKLLISGKGYPVKKSSAEIFAGNMREKFEKNETRIIWTARIVVFSLAVVCICLGAFNGGVTDVLNKAINICTECIGLG